MSLPAVNMEELDGALGVLPPSAGNLHALVGVSSKGPLNVPATFARVKDITKTYESGPLVESACHYVDRYGKPVILVRADATIPGTVSAVESFNAAGTGPATGTSVVTVSESPPAAPVDDLEIVLMIVKGGTVGTVGITYQLSVDGGRTKGAVQSLGTATAITAPGVGVKLELAAGTLVAGESYQADATAPQWEGPGLQAALDALAATTVAWDVVQIVGEIDPNTFDVIELKIAGMQAAGKPRAWIGNTRMPDGGESEATYLGALSTEFASKTTLFGELCAGACKLTSSVSGRKYRRPISHAVAGRQASVSEEINIAAVDTGALPGVAIRDINGNIDEHDEAINPGLDDARFTVLRTWDGYQGVYVCRPRIFSPDGSDFQLMPHRRVMNLGEIALRVYLIHRCNKPILVNRTTGFILETEALDIEAGANAVLAARLLAKPKASDAVFVLARNDNVLSTKTINGDARITPLAYPEFFNITIGYYNPALQVVAV